MEKESYDSRIVCNLDLSLHVTEDASIIEGYEEKCNCKVVEANLTRSRSTRGCLTYSEV